MWRDFIPLPHAAILDGASARQLETRPRLEATLRRALGKRVSIVVAAPGYGKSTVLARMARLDSRAAVSYACSANDTGASLARHFAGALGGAFVLETTGASLTSDWATGLEAVASTVTAPRLVLLDDVDSLDRSDLERLIQLLSKDSRSAWHVALTTSRELEGGQFEHLLRTGQAERLDEFDLGFDPEEARAAMEGQDLNGADAEAACIRWWGWPPAVLGSRAGDGDFTDYFEELVERQQPRIRDFLESTAILDVVTPAACRAVIGARSATALLDQVVSAHLFLLHRPQGLVYHPCFRSMLLDIAAKRPRRLSVVAQRAADHFLAAGDEPRALQALGASGAWSRAVEIFCHVAPRAVAANRGADLLDWLVLFPADLARRQPWLVHYRAVALRLTGDDLAAAWHLQERARDAFAAAGDAQGRTHAIAELGTLASLLGRPAEAERLLEEARAELTWTDSYLQARVLCSLADAYLSLNRIEEATLAGEEALALAVDESPEAVSSSQIRALWRLGMIFLREGDLGQAHDVAMRARAVAEDEPDNPDPHVLASYLGGVVHWAWGDFDKALQLLSEATQWASKHGRTMALYRAQASLADVLANLGRLDEAEALLAAAGSPPVHLADLGTLRFLQDRLVEARTTFRRGLERASKTGNVAEVGRAKAALGAIALRMGHVAEAEQWLLDAARGFEQTGQQFRLAGTYLHLAHAYLLKDDPSRWKRFLKHALEFALRGGYYTFFLWHPHTAAIMATAALREGIHTDYAEALCHRRLGSAQLREFLPLVSDPDAAVRQAATRIVRGFLERGPEAAWMGELNDCRDPAVRARLTSALVEERLTPHGLVVLRHHHNLTWAELDVFVNYYLTDLRKLTQGDEPERRALARRLHLSENTLMHHITSIRHKLQLGGRRGSASVFLWALLSNITRLPDSANSRSVAI